MPLATLAGEVDPDLADVFLQNGRRLFRCGKVPWQVAANWRWRLRAEWGTPEALRDFMASGLALVVEHDGRRLTEGIGDRCGRALIVRYGPGLRPPPCDSQRCPYCAPIVGRRWADRIIAQSERDAAAGRAPLCFGTLTVDRAAYSTFVAAQRDLVRKVSAFRRWFGRTFGPNATLVCVEYHDAGWPHVHFLMRCAGLASAMLRESGGTWGELQERVRTPDMHGRCAVCPFPGVRHSFVYALRRAGLGRAGSYLAPVWSPEGSAWYVTKPPNGEHAAPYCRNDRRFRASGRAGDGKEATFFADEG